MTKGNLCSKLRVIYKDSETKIYKITNKTRFDRSVYEYYKSGKSENNEKIDSLKNIKIEGSLKARDGNLEGLTKENKFDTLNEFMESIDFNNKNSETIQSRKSKSFDEENIMEDVINNKVFNQLRSMFCTDSKNINASSVIELKSQGNYLKLLKSFNSFKDSINSYILLTKNFKISELICDFIEDHHKQIYFLQLKSYKCVSITHVPLKSLKPKKNFSCPGDFCNTSLPINPTKLFAGSILMPTRSILPKRCKVLRGTILQEKIEKADELQKLNIRLFERVEVCENCFTAYNEKSEKKDNFSLPKKNYFVSEENLVFGKEKTKKIQMNKDPQFMSELGKKFYNFNKETLSKTFANLRTKTVVRKQKESIFDGKKKSIDQAIHFDEFVI